MNAKNLALALGCVGLLAVLLGTAGTSIGQTQSVPAEDPQVAKLVDQIVQQQKEMSDNQTAIEAQLQTIAEDVRVARIFVSRTGGKTK